MRYGRIKDVPNPMNLGKYEQIRAKNVATYRQKLLEQIDEDARRKAVETYQEQEVGKLRAECAGLMKVKEDTDKQERYKQNVMSAKKEHEDQALIEEIKKVLSRLHIIVDGR